MKNSVCFKQAALIVAGSLVFLWSCTKEASNDGFIKGDPGSGVLLKSGANGADMYVVALNDDFDGAAELSKVNGYDRRKEVMTGYLNRFLQGKGIDGEQVEQVYATIFPGFSAKLSAPQLERLLGDPRVKSIEPDQSIALGKPTPPPPPPPQPAQIIPWGTLRVGGPVDATGKRAWIIDSGIDYECPDLNVDKVNSRCFVPGRTKKQILSPDDQYGHGTACAGQLAAINNGIGTVGVAAGAWVVAVRVLNENGGGMESYFLAGADYVATAAKPGEVVSISLGYPASDAIDNAVIKLGNLGIKVAMSAGNDYLPTFKSPGRAEGVNLYTVAAFSEGDVWASFSNYGPHVDFCAPGVNCYTCWLDGAYLYGGGTSAAAPHVAGLLLLGDVVPGGYVVCPADGVSYPVAHN